MLKLVTGQQPIMMRSKKVSPVLGERKKAYGYPEASLEEGKYLDHILNMASMVTFYSFFFFHQLICFCYIHNYISEQVIGLACSSLTKHIGTS